MVLTKLLIGTVIASFLSFANPVFAEKTVYEQEIVSTNLTGIVYKLSQKEGEKQLRKLATDGNKEDFWYYLPEKEKWIDCGRGIEQHTCLPDPTMLVYFKFSKKEFQDVKEIIHYQIHPTDHKGFNPDWSTDINVAPEDLKNFRGFLPLLLGI